jgi:hypothetical protein
MPKDLIVKAIKPMTFTYKAREDYYFDILGKGFSVTDKVVLTIDQVDYPLVIERVVDDKIIRAKFTPKSDITLAAEGVAKTITTSGEIEITVTNEEESDGGMYP